MEQTAREAYKASVLRSFIAKDGSLRSIPAQYKRSLSSWNFWWSSWRQGGNIRKRTSMCLSSAITRIMRRFGENLSFIDL